MPFCFDGAIRRAEQTSAVCAMLMVCIYFLWEPPPPSSGNDGQHLCRTEAIVMNHMISHTLLEIYAMSPTLMSALFPVCLSSLKQTMIPLIDLVYYHGGPIVINTMLYLWTYELFCLIDVSFGIGGISATDTSSLCMAYQSSKVRTYILLASACKDN